MAQYLVHILTVCACTVAIHAFPRPYEVFGSVQSNLRQGPGAMPYRPSRNPIPTVGATMYQPHDTMQQPHEVNTPGARFVDDRYDYMQPSHDEFMSRRHAAGPSPRQPQQSMYEYDYYGTNRGMQQQQQQPHFDTESHLTVVPRGVSPNYALSPLKTRIVEGFDQEDEALINSEQMSMAESDLDMDTGYGGNFIEKQRGGFNNYASGGNFPQQNRQWPSQTSGNRGFAQTPLAQPFDLPAYNDYDMYEQQTPQPPQRHYPSQQGRKTFGMNMNKAGSASATMANSMQGYPQPQQQFSHPQYPQSQQHHMTTSPAQSEMHEMHDMHDMRDMRMMPPRPMGPMANKRPQMPMVQPQQSPPASLQTPMRLNTYGTMSQMSQMNPMSSMNSMGAMGHNARITSINFGDDDVDSVEGKMMQLGQEDDVSDGDEDVSSMIDTDGTTDVSQKNMRMYTEMPMGTSEQKSRFSMTSVGAKSMGSMGGMSGVNSQVGVGGAGSSMAHLLGQSDFKQMVDEEMTTTTDNGSNGASSTSNGSSSVSADDYES